MALQSSSLFAWVPNVEMKKDPKQMTFDIHFNFMSSQIKSLHFNHPSGGIRATLKAFKLIIINRHTREEETKKGNPQYRLSQQKNI